MKFLDADTAAAMGEHAAAHGLTELEAAQMLRAKLAGATHAIALKYMRRPLPPRSVDGVKDDKARKLRNKAKKERSR